MTRYYARTNKNIRNELIKYGHFNHALNIIQSESTWNINRRLQQIDRNVDQTKIHENVNIKALYCLRLIKSNPVIKCIVYDYLKPFFLTERKQRDYTIDRNFKRNMGIAITTTLHGIPTRAYKALMTCVSDIHIYIYTYTYVHMHTCTACTNLCMHGLFVLCVCCLLVWI